MLRYEAAFYSTPSSANLFQNYAVQMSNCSEPHARWISASMGVGFVPRKPAHAAVVLDKGGGGGAVQQL